MLHYVCFSLPQNPFSSCSAESCIRDLAKRIRCRLLRLTLPTAHEGVDRRVTLSWVVCKRRKTSLSFSQACSASGLVRKTFPISHLSVSKWSASHRLFSTTPVSVIYQYSASMDGIHRSEGTRSLLRVLRSAAARSFLRALAIVFLMIANICSRVVLHSDAPMIAPLSRVVADRGPLTGRRRRYGRQGLLRTASFRRP